MTPSPKSVLLFVALVQMADGVFRKQVFITPWERNHIVHLHNKYRREEQASNMEYMRWDNNLAATAQAHANRCMLQHTSPAQRNYAGENLYAGGFIEYDDAMRRFWVEKYDCPCSNPPVYTHCCGHYSQIVWATTNRVGCGLAECSHIAYNGVWVNWQYSFVCHYAPNGNHYFRHAFSYGTQCSRCPAHAPNCHTGLCY